MGTKTLVTGAAGRVGSRIVRELAERQEKVVAAVHTPEKAEGLEWPDSVEVIRFDWDDPATWGRSDIGIDKVMIIPPGVDGRLHERMIPAIERFRGDGVTRFVNLAWMGTEQDESDPMRIVEEHLLRSGTSTTYLRPNWFMQNFEGFIRPMITHAHAMSLPAGEGRTSFVDLRDVADVAVAALTDELHVGKAYTLTGPEALTYREAAGIIGERIGRSVEYLPLSDDEAQAAWIAQGWEPEWAAGIVELYGKVRTGNAERVTDDVQGVLGRSPIGFRQYAAERGDVWI